MSLLNPPKLADPAPPAAPRPEPTPRAQPDFTLHLNFVRFAIDSDPATAKAAKALEKEIQTLEKSWQEDMKGCCGFSFDDARAEYRANIRDAIDGKFDPSQLQTKQDLIERNARIRRIAKDRAGIHSLEANRLMADFLEGLKKHVPSYSEKMLQTERAIFKTGGDKSHLALLIAALPDFIDRHVAKMRQPHRTLTRPQSLLELI